jgi:GNAT superfamily N-acetyltransferase
MILPAVRPAQAGDAEILIQLRQAYYESQLALGLLDQPSDVATHVRSGTPGVLTSGRARVLVAEHDSEIIGYAIASFRIVPGTCQPSVCSIDEVFVSPRSRGTGLAKQLVANLLDEAALRKADRVQIRVLSGNPKARTLWEQLGFVENVIILEYAGAPPKSETRILRGGQDDR